MRSGQSNLENLVRVRQLHAEASDAREVAKHLATGRRLLKDAHVPDLSAVSRFTIAYDAAHLLALAALRFAGYRPVGSGHRRVLFQVLEFTAKASPQLSRALAQHHDRRNKVQYEAVDPSELEAADLVKLVDELETLVARVVKT